MVITWKRLHNLALLNYVSTHITHNYFYLPQQNNDRSNTYTLEIMHMTTLHATDNVQCCLTASSSISKATSYQSNTMHRDLSFTLNFLVLGISGWTSTSFETWRGAICENCEPILDWTTSKEASCIRVVRCSTWKPSNSMVGVQSVELSVLVSPSYHTSIRKIYRLLRYFPNFFFW